MAPIVNKVIQEAGSVRMDESAKFIRDRWGAHKAFVAAQKKPRGKTYFLMALLCLTEVFVCYRGVHKDKTFPLSEALHLSAGKLYLYHIEGLSHEESKHNAEQGQYTLCQ